MGKAAFIFIMLTFSAFSVSAQAKEARQVEEFGDLYCDDAMARTDQAAIALLNEPDSKIYIIFYTGKRYRHYIYDKKLKGDKYRKVFLRPQWNEARMNVLRWKSYLTFQRGISNKKVILVDGGYRENHTVELWLVPEGAEPPKPSPTLERKDIKFRKGKAPYQECLVG